MPEFLPRWCTGPSRVQPISTKERKHQSRPRLETLEDRFPPGVFDVNSLADILNLPAGVVTLGSAIEAANATPGGNDINQTVPGSYSITLPGRPGEVNNATGEVTISAAGGNLTLRNTSTVIVTGNHLARVFDINPIFVLGSAIVTDAGGGIRDNDNANLTLTNMVITNNIPSAAGGGVSMASLLDTVWALTLNNTTISDNHAGDRGGGEEDGSGTRTPGRST
jgi:hypothetical protein